MATSVEVKAHCPSCGAKYRLAAGMIGRKARCAKCQTLFRIADPSIPSPDSLPAALSSASSQPSSPQALRNGDLKHPPTEDDILRWLAEAENDADHERRAERNEDGLDAFDMPATIRDASVPTATRHTYDDVSTAPRLRLRVAEEDENLVATGAPVRRAM